MADLILPDDDGTYIVRIFVSSTFLDMQRERDTLVRRTFPALRARFRARGIEVLEVDLRWGITQQQAESGATLSICLAEIDRCRPYFIGLIGERYGWIPPTDLLTAEVRSAFPAAATGMGRSMTELEVLHAISRDPAAVQNALFFMRDPAWVETLPEAERTVYVTADPTARAKHADFKAQIRASGAQIIEYGGPEAFGPAVEAALGGLLDARFPAIEAPDPFVKDGRLHEAYARERRGIHVGAGSAIEALDAWAFESSARPVVVTGPSGSGKSTLLVNWLHARRLTKPQDWVFAHYLGASPDSADPQLLLRRLWEYLNRVTGREVPVPSLDRPLMDVAAGLAERLSEAALEAAERGISLVIALDGLDKLTSEANLRWLPRTLPPPVRILASSLEGEALDATLDRGWTRVDVPPLGRDHAALLIERLLAAWGRSLSPERIDRILAHPLATNPLFVKSVLEELRYSATHARLDDRIDFYLRADDMPDLFARLLQRLEQDLGRDATAALLKPVWVSRSGLEEADIIEVSKVPPLVWAALRNGLGNSIRNQRGRITFGHDFLRRAVEERYLSGDEHKKQAHLDLAQHYRSAPVDPRWAEEYPYQLRAAQAWGPLKALLTDLDRIETLRTRGDVELLGYWLPLSERGHMPEWLLADAFFARVDVDREWSDSEIDLAFALESFFDVAGARGAGAERLDRACLAACQRRYGARHRRTLDSQSRLAETLLARGDLRGARDLWSSVLDAQTVSLGAEHEDTLSTLNNLAQAEKAMGRLTEAQSLQERALEAETRVLGADHASTLTSQNNLADLLAERGDLEGAEALFERVHAATSRLLGPEHPNTLATAHNLAGVVAARGNRARALELERKVLDVRVRLLGPEHPTTLTSVNNVAVNLLALGDLEGAEALQARVTEAIKRQAGPDHPDTLVALNNLAQMLDDRGRSVEALALFQEAHEGAERTLGPEHPSTLTILGNLASALRDRGDGAEARRYQERIVDVRRRRFGGDHPQTLVALNNLAHTLLSLGEPAAAVELAEEAASVSAARLGLEHPDTLNSHHNLAGALMARGQSERAIAIFERILASRTERLGPDHPDTLNTLSSVAHARQAVGDLAAAVQLRRKVYDGYTRRLGGVHADTLSAGAGLAGALTAAGELTEARDLLERARDTAAENLGANHPTTLAVATVLASTLKAAGELSPALQIEERTYSVRRDRFGPQHPDTLLARNNLAQTLHSNGAYAVAEPHFVELLAARERMNGPEHPDTLVTVVNLAQTRKGLGDIEGALRLEERALEALRRRLGEAHPLTLTAMSNLVGTHRFRGDLTSAEALETRVLRVRRRVLGPEHPDTLRSLNVLGEIYHALGDLESAVACLELATEGRRATLGAHHPDALTSQLSLGAVVWTRGDLERAHTLMHEAHGVSLQHWGADHALTVHAARALEALKIARTTSNPEPADRA